MLFSKRKQPKYCPSVPSQASAGSSEDLDVLFRDFENTAISDALPQMASDTATSLTSQGISSLGKVHKAKILEHWIACQTYLTEAEIRSRAAYLAQSETDLSLSETTTRSGLSSRTSTSLSVLGVKQPPRRRRASLWYALANRKPSSTSSNNTLACIGLSYDSLSPALKASPLRTEYRETVLTLGEWNELESAWRSALHLPGPHQRSKTKSKAKAARE